MVTVEIDPGFVLRPIVNVLLSVIARTSNNPLNPEFAEPLALFTLLKRLISMRCPVFNPCGYCVVTTPTFEDQEALIILVFVLRFVTDVSVVLSFL